MLYAYIFVSEIYSTIILIFSLLFFTFLSQRKKFLKDLNKFSWFIILILSIFYFLSLLTSNTNIFYLSCGIYSNSVLYALRLVLSFIFIFYILYLKTELKNFVFYSYEFFIILFFSFLSLNMLLLSSNFINIFIFLEFFSICTFYLLSAQKTYEKSLEASIKYFIFSSLASAIFLFGMFLIYYSTGINDLFELLLLSTNNLFLTNNTIYIVGAILICFGLIFKIGAGIFFFEL